MIMTRAIMRQTSCCLTNGQHEGSGLTENTLWVWYNFTVIIKWCWGQTKNLQFIKTKRMAFFLFNSQGNLEVCFIWSGNSHKSYYSIILQYYQQRLLITLTCCTVPKFPFSKAHKIESRSWSDLVEFNI